MKKLMALAALFACFGNAQAVENPLFNLINELTAAVSQPAPLEVRGRTGSKRYGGYTKSGKGSRYYGGYVKSGRGRRK